MPKEKSPLPSAKTCVSLSDAFAPGSVSVPLNTEMPGSAHTCPCGAVIQQVTCSPGAKLLPLKETWSDKAPTTPGDASSDAVAVIEFPTNVTFVSAPIRLALPRATT